MKKIELLTLSEDQVTEALSRYLRDGPFNYSFDNLLIEDIDFFDGDFVFKIELSDES